MDYVPTPIWVFCMDTTTWTVYKSMVDMVFTIIIFCCVLEEYVKIERLYHDISFLRALRALHTHFSDALAPDFPASGPTESYRGFRSYSLKNSNTFMPFR